MSSESQRDAHARTLILVRHGETEGQSSIRYYGRTDVALSELGRAQMRAVRRQLQAIEASFVGQVFSSPLLRALEGAKLIAGNGAPVVTVDEFTEVYFGWFEGLTAGEIRERYPAEFKLWRSDRLALTYAYPGGESRAAFDQRVSLGLTRILTLIEAGSSRQAQRALVVAHRGVIRTIVRTLTGTEAAVELGSIQILKSRDASKWHPSHLDMTDHLRCL